MKKGTTLKVLVVLAIWLGFFGALSILPVYSQKATALTTQGISQFAADAKCATKILGIPTWYQYLPTNAECQIDNSSLEQDTVVLLIIMAMIDILLTLSGILAVGFIIFGGFKYITSQAEPSKLVAARQTILNALIGLVIAIIASRVVAFIAGRLA